MPKDWTRWSYAGASNSQLDFTVTTALNQDDSKDDSLINIHWVIRSNFATDINQSNVIGVISEYARANAAQFDAVVKAARAAFPTWSTANIQARADATEKIGTRNPVPS